jgi:predicted DNA-binding transcriptional regulator YafY
MRGKNLVQLIRTLGLLSRPQGVTRKELSLELGISIRSVSRAIQLVEELNIPVYDDRDGPEREKHWRIEPAYLSRMPNLDLPKIALSLPEIISLSMLAGESVIFRGTDISRHIASAIAKLMLFLPEDTQTELSALKRIFICKTMGSKTYAGKEDTIRTLTESILDRTACRITYHAFYKDEITEEDIGPLHFYENRGGLYLFAVKLKNRQVRSYAVERIRRIRLLNRSTTYPPGFDPEKTLDSAFDLTHGDPVSVKIRFSPAVARYIKEKTWAGDQTLTEHPDGSLILTMTSSGRRDIKSWVLSFGKDALLLEPDDLKQEIRADLEKSLSDMKEKQFK